MRVFRVSAVRRLAFEQGALSVFDTYRLNRTNEAGGILLGRVYKSEIVVEIATVPTSADQAGTFFFERSRHVSQELVNAAWTASDGEQNYLGEWHSHLYDIAVPSSRDRTMILNNLREVKTETDFLVLVVLGWKQDWVGIATNRTIRQLPPIL